MKKLRIWKFGPASLGVMALIVASGVYFAAANRTKAPEYQTAEVVRGDIEIAISAAGKLQPKNYVDVGAQVSGQLEEVFFEVGDKVEKGDLLARIDETLAAADVEADRAQMKESKASYAQQEATLELAVAEAKRADTLYKADAISQAEYQAAIAARKVANARLTQLEAQIERQNSTLEADLATLEFTKIYAPMSGTVVSQTALVGQTLNANQTTPTILQIADLSVMTVEAEVSEADVLRIQKQQDAYFTTLGGGGERWTTTVRQVLPEPEVLNDVVLYKALLDIENEDERLKTEMTAQVFFITGAAEDAILVPVAALRNIRERPAGSERRKTNDRPSLMAAQARDLQNGDNPEKTARTGMREIIAANPDAERKIVLVMENGAPRPTPVLIGLQNRTQAEVLYGLEPGDIVVTGDAAITSPKRDNNNRENRPRGFRRLR